MSFLTEKSFSCNGLNCIGLTPQFKVLCSKQMAGQQKPAWSFLCCSLSHLINLLLHYGISATLGEAGGPQMPSERFMRCNYLKRELTSPFSCLNSFHAPLKKQHFFLNYSTYNRLRVISYNKLLLKSKYFPPRVHSGK